MILHQVFYFYQYSYILLFFSQEVDGTMITFAELVEMYPAAEKDDTLMRGERY